MPSSCGLAEVGHALVASSCLQGYVAPVVVRLAEVGLKLDGFVVGGCGKVVFFKFVEDIAFVVICHGGAGREADCVVEVVGYVVERLASERCAGERVGTLGGRRVALELISAVAPARV